MSAEKESTAKITITGSNEEVGRFFSCLHHTATSLRLQKPVEITFAGYNYYITIRVKESAALLLKNTIENGSLKNWKDAFWYL